MSYSVGERPEYRDCQVGVCEENDQVFSNGLITVGTLVDILWQFSPNRVAAWPSIGNLAQHNYVEVRWKLFQFTLQHRGHSVRIPIRRNPQPVRCQPKCSPISSRFADPQSKLPSSSQPPADFGDCILLLQNS